MKNAVIYARVSTDEQAEKGYSIRSQIEACEQYAERLALEVSKVITDDYSGAKLNRPGLTQLRDLVAANEINAVIVYSSDRWTRNIVDKELLRSELRKAKVDLHYVNRGKSENTPEAEMTEDMEGVFDKYWRAKIIESCRRGRNRKAKENHQVMTGFAPYGYKRDGKGKEAKLLINDDEAEIVRSIFEWYTIGDESGFPLSMRAIAEKLTGIDEKGNAIYPPLIPTPDRLRPLPEGKERTRKIARYWHSATVRGILTNEIYIGRTYYGKSRIIEEKKVKQPRDQWIPIDVPQLKIVDRNIFDLAQGRIKRNIELQKRNRKNEYLLSGFFRCGVCNASMVGSILREAGKYVYRYYRCGTHWHRPLKAECPNEDRWVSGRLVEGKAWNWLENLLKDENDLNEALNEMEARKVSEADPKLKRLEVINGLVDKLERNIKRLARDSQEAEDDFIAEILKGEMKLAGQKREDLVKERKKLEMEVSKWLITADKRVQILSRAVAIRDRMIDPTYQQKRALLDLLDFKAIFRVDDRGRWLDVCCGLKPEGDIIVLDHS